MNPLQWFSFSIALVFFIVEILRMRLNPEKIFIRIPVVLVVIHYYTFYLFLHLNDLGLIHNKNLFGIFDTMEWSSALKFHMVITFLGIELYGYLRDKIWKKVQSQI